LSSYHYEQKDKFEHILCFFSILICSAQSYKNIISTSSENTPDSTIFQNCLDSIQKYVYLDSRKIKPYIALCEEMLANGKELSNRHRLDYVIQIIYDEFNYNNYLGIVKIIEDNRKMLDMEGVLYSQKTLFNYLDGYTSLVLGEIESAQSTFQGMLDVAKTENDTIVMLQAHNSLGKLLTEQGDFDNAEKHLLEFYKMIPLNKQLHRTKANIELVDLYFKKNQTDKVQYYNEIGLHEADSLNAFDLKLEFLLNKVNN